MRCFSSFLACTVFATACSLPALAETTKSEDVIRYRKASMVVTKRHYDRLRKFANGGLPFAATTMEQDAAVLYWLSQEMEASFPPGSDEGDTAATGAISSDASRFRAVATSYRTATRDLKDKRPKDGTKLKPLIDEVGKQCKSCHDDFKKS
jgi:cytochrome c556